MQYSNKLGKLFRRSKSCSRYEPGLDRNLYISIVEIKRFLQNVIRVCQKKTCIRPLLIHAWHTRIVIDFARINFPDSINRFHPCIFPRSPTVGTCCVPSKRVIFHEQNPWKCFRPHDINDCVTWWFYSSLPIVIRFHSNFYDTLLWIVVNCTAIIIENCLYFRMIINIHHEFSRVQMREYFRILCIFRIIMHISSSFDTFKRTPYAIFIGEQTIH